MAAKGRNPLSASGGTIAPWLASVTFGGPDLKTVYLGSLKGNTISLFPLARGRPADGPPASRHR